MNCYLQWCLVVVLLMWISHLQKRSHLVAVWFFNIVIHLFLHYWKALSCLLLLWFFFSWCVKYSYSVVRNAIVTLIVLHMNITNSFTPSCPGLSFDGQPMFYLFQVINFGIVKFHLNVEHNFNVVRLFFLSLLF